jgi:hypothetical protein
MKTLIETLDEIINQMQAAAPNLKVSGFMYHPGFNEPYDACIEPVTPGSNSLIGGKTFEEVLEKLAVEGSIEAAEIQRKNKIAQLEKELAELKKNK